jgi:hypothetical protein
LRGWQALACLGQLGFPPLVSEVEDPAVAEQQLCVVRRERKGLMQVVLSLRERVERERALAGLAQRAYSLRFERRGVLLRRA